MLELDDIHALWERRVPMDRYGELLKESFDILYRGTANRTARLLVLHLHPWVIGQPFRIGFLDDALGHMRRPSGGVGPRVGRRLSNGTAGISPLSDALGICLLILDTTQRHKPVMIVVPWRRRQTPGRGHKLVAQWPDWPSAARR